MTAPAKEPPAGGGRAAGQDGAGRKGGDNGHGTEMREAVDLRLARRTRWQREGERSVWRNLAMLGAFGWLIAIPPLLGVLAGRWLDDRLGTGIQFSAALIVLGVVLGGWLVWRRIDRE